MARTVALRTLSRIEEGAFSHIVLGAELDHSDLDDRDRGLVTELVYGVLTWRRALDRLLEPRLSRGLSKTPPVTRDILRIGAYQLVFLDRIPKSAAVNTSVELAKANQPATAPVVNSVLRSLSAEESYQWWDDDDRQAKPLRYLGDRYSLPGWIANLFLQKYGGVDRAAPYADAYTKRPQLHFRNVSDAAIPESATPHPVVPNAFSSAKMSPELRQGLIEGRWVVQDIGAQLIGWYCGFEQGPVLDACAGLGGKSLHQAATHRVVAVEPVASKLELLDKAANLLNLAAQIDPKPCRLEDLDETLYPSVLLDAPCTALGVIRRHPESRWSRSKHDMKAMADIQSDLVDQAIERTAPGGTFVYAVCTFSPAETYEQVQKFVQRYGLEQLEPPDAPFDWAPFINKKGWLELNPLDHDSDGFFAARFRKPS